MDYAEVKIVINENKITREGKYPVNYIFHHIKCIAKTREIYLDEEQSNKSTGRHVMTYRIDYADNQNAPYTAAIFATLVYCSPAKNYIDSMIVYDSKSGNIEDSISSIKEMENKYGSI